MNLRDGGRYETIPDQARTLLADMRYMRTIRAHYHDRPASRNNTRLIISLDRIILLLKGKYVDGGHDLEAKKYYDSDSSDTDDDDDTRSFANLLL